MTKSRELPDLTDTVTDQRRVQLGELLGSGAYGRVYKALDSTSPGEPAVVAVKCLKKYPIGTREAVFQAREIKHHGILSKHDNIVTLHRTFVENDYVFLVLDYCPGGDLFGVITDRRLFVRNDSMVKQAFAQILDAVEFCHSQGIYHRDLKPENILACEQGLHLRLSDLGLSSSNLVTSEHGLGSPYYMAYEAIASSHTSFSCRSADVWALAVILTNMLTGRNPWRMAHPRDDCFHAFMRDRDFLLKSLPISNDANALLKGIFNLEPSFRPTIPQIRELISKIPTFFLTDAELADATPSQQAIAEAYSSPCAVDKTEEEELEYPPPESGSCGEHQTGSTEVYIYEEQPFTSKLLAPPGQPASSDAVSVSSSDTSSSNGPVTPASNPTEPAIDVPELPEGEGISSSRYLGPKQTEMQNQLGVDAGNVKMRSTFKKALRKISKVMG
ncbi:Serine/threonine protein kinase [Mycena chlorophos]|uniref:non-specific serine/threonine protein kinase n=1 Tax=Mycena chlorophos TaxID=658473 RepID=A0A8H6S467_MYCCL|nr:Serine/threonine protein kinase [Mycena chlorophos]